MLCSGHLVIHSSNQYFCYNVVVFITQVINFRSKIYFTDILLDEILLVITAFPLFFDLIFGFWLKNPQLQLEAHVDRDWEAWLWMKQLTPYSSVALSFMTLPTRLQPLQWRRKTKFPSRVLVQQLPSWVKLIPTEETSAAELVDAH